MRRKKIFILGAAAVLAAAAVSITFTSCRSMAGRYIGYRLSPDDVEAKGRIPAELPSGVMLEGQVEIYLDDYSVPHIRADNEHDLYFALGYMQARDRRFQLEMFKMLSHGRLRELIGDRDPTGVLKRMEFMSRALGFYRDGETMWERASSRDRAVLSAFAEGINAATKVEPIPMEFRILNYSPEPWEPQDSLVIIAMNAFGLCKNWEMELARLELVIHQLRTGETIGRALEIFPPWFEWPPYLYEKSADLRELPAVAPELAEYLKSLPPKLPAEKENTGMKKGKRPAAWTFSFDFLEPFLRGEAASNNWAVDGNWTGTGKAALSSDPHMPHMLPSLGYLFHLELTGRPDAYRIIGGTFVGFPGIAFGTNGSAAWGVTSNWADVTDLYVEKPVPGRDGYYYHGGKELPFEKRTEVFKIRRDEGRFDTEEVDVRSTVHGVVVNDFVKRVGDDFPLLAIKRNRSFGTPISALLQLYEAETINEAGKAIEEAFVFTGHWAVADEKGNIGYIGSANLPNRTSHLGTFPSPGWTGEYEWGEPVSKSQLPWLVNPENGIIATANQQVYPPFSFPFPVNLEGGTSFRYRRIAELLREGRVSASRSLPEANPNVSSVAETFSSIQTDGIFLGWETVRSLFTRSLAPLVNDDDQLVSKAAALLLTWDGDCRGDVRGSKNFRPALYNTLVAFAFRNAMSDELSEKSLDFYLFYYNITPFLYNLLLNPKNPAWDNRHTDNRETYNEALQKAFTDAVLALRDAYGGDIENWAWDESAPFVLKHPFGEVEALAGYLNRGPIGTGGMSDTIYAHQYERNGLFSFPIKGGPILRIAVDLDDLPGSIMSLPGGMSGRPASEHYDDMLPLFMKGVGVSMEMDFERIRKHAAGEIVFIHPVAD